MSIEKKKDGGASGSSTLAIVLKFIGLFFIDAMALILVYALYGVGNLAFAFLLGLAVIIVNVIVLREELYPLRWMALGFFFVILFVIYPILNTVYVAFTNYGDGHRETKEEVLLRLSSFTYEAENTNQYNFALYWKENDQTTLGVWLTRQLDDGTYDVAWGTVGAPIETLDVEDPTPPDTFRDFVKVPDDQATPTAINNRDLIYGVGDDTAQLRGLRTFARPAYQPRYIYDPAADTLLDQQENVLYTANDETGFFVSPTGDELDPGYSVVIGGENFSRFFSDPRLQGPLITIFIWTVMFAFLSVFTTFVAGLFLAIIFNSARLPGKKIIRSLLIIPYAIPGVISVVIWRGMLNQELGFITKFIEDVLHFQVYWFVDVQYGGAWTRFIVILVNLWLGYPYMMLICSGALQAIPTDIYEAAAVDGASPLERFWNITLPLLLVSVGPLLIASFVYNFNNYLLLEALTQGGPPIPGATTAGYTDILIRYVYQLAFGNGVTADYGYASAISLVIFAIVATITLFQYRITRTWEEVGENV